LRAYACRAVAAIGGWIEIAIIAAAAVVVFLLLRIPRVARWNKQMAPRYYRGMKDSGDQKP
jgi:hypothetical protein